jgi:hypothetical protein
MRLVLATLLVGAAACSGDVNTTRDPQNSSDPGVDGGVKTDGGGSTTVGDARVPPPFDAAVDASPDAPPQPLTPCEEATMHSDLAWIQQAVFAKSCTGGSCHDATSPQAQLDLTAPHAYGELVSVKSTIYTSWNLVTPGDPDASMLMVRLGGASGPDVDVMPKGQPALCAEKVDAIRRWIAAGAAND